MSSRYFFLKDYLNELNKIQSGDFIPILYPEINNKKFSKLERRIKEK